MLLAAARAHCSEESLQENQLQFGGDQDSGLEKLELDDMLIL